MGVKGEKGQRSKQYYLQKPWKGADSMRGYVIETAEGRGTSTDEEKGEGTGQDYSLCCTENPDS